MSRGAGNRTQSARSRTAHPTGGPHPVVINQSLRSSHSAGKLTLMSRTSGTKLTGGPHPETPSHSTPNATIFRMKLTEKHINYFFVATLCVAIVIFAWHFSPQPYLDFQQKILDQSNELISKLQSPLNTTPVSTPIPSPNPYVYHPPTPEQAEYALAMSAILSTYNQETYSTLASDMYPTTLKPLMEQWWDITDRQTSLLMLNWLRDDGHRVEYNQAKEYILDNQLKNCTDVAKFAGKNNLNFPPSCDNTVMASQYQLLSTLSSKIGNHSLLAWDYGRLISVARWSYTLGWISEQEAWEYIMPATQALQKEYSSWKEYGEQYLLGRAYWQQSTSANQYFDRVYQQLINPAFHSSWTTLNWQTNLD